MLYILIAVSFFSEWFHPLYSHTNFLKSGTWLTVGTSWMLVQCTIAHTASILEYVLRSGIRWSPHEAFSVEATCWERVDLKYRTWGFNCFHCNENVIVFNPRAVHNLSKNLVILWGTEQAKVHKLKRTEIKCIVITKKWFIQPPGLEIDKPLGMLVWTRGTVPSLIGLSVYNEENLKFNKETKTTHMMKWLQIKNLWNRR